MQPNGYCSILLRFAFRRAAAVFSFNSKLLLYRFPSGTNFSRAYSPSSFKREFFGMFHFEEALFESHSNFIISIYRN